MRNPFVVGIVTGEAFCNRESVRAELLTRIQNSQSVVLYAKRRFGKSAPAHLDW